MTEGMRHAREALKLLINQLPSENTKFNIISFGTWFTKLWENPKGKWKLILIEILDKKLKF